MAGTILDQKVFEYLVERTLPMLSQHFKVRDIPLSLASLPWFLSLYLASMPVVFAFRVVDCVLAIRTQSAPCFSFSLFPFWSRSSSLPKTDWVEQFSFHFIIPLAQRRFYFKSGDQFLLGLKNPAQSELGVLNYEITVLFSAVTSLGERKFEAFWLVKLLIRLFMTPYDHFFPL